MSGEYWKDRQAAAQTKLLEKNTKEIEAQLRKYYKRTSSHLISEYERVFNKLYNTVVRDNLEPTPADLYKLDAYWKLQGDINKQLYILGDKQVKVNRKYFVNHWLEIYNSIYLGDNAAFSEVDKETALQMINHIWCADGKSWSDRVWSNTNKLQQALNDGLIECVVGGRDERFLKNTLMEKFNVSFARADSLVKTELAHIQTQAAAKRYEDAGVKEFEVWADKDERRCDVCGKLHQKRYLIGEAVPIPAHPRCRCCIIPVVE